MRYHSIHVWIVLGTILSMSLVALIGQQAQAAPGDLVKQTTFDTDCPSSIGVGAAFDGSNLWYSCYNSFTDLYRADPITGVTTASYSIFQGIGAIAYDKVNNAIYTSPGSGNFSGIGKVQLDAGKNVVSVTQLFPVAGGLWDGLGYDGSDQTLYGGPDSKFTIQQYMLNGSLVKSFPGRCLTLGASCANAGGTTSGVAVGGNFLYEGTDGGAHVYVVDKTTINATYAGDDFFNFTTVIPGDTNFRDEGLTCDPVTFAVNGTEVMWSKEAFNPMRAAAFEIPAGSCGFGGQPPGPGPSPTVGGEILSTDMAALFVAGAFANATWMLPAAGGAAVALVLGIIRSRRHK